MFAVYKFARISSFLHLGREPILQHLRGDSSQHSSFRWLPLSYPLVGFMYYTFSRRQWAALPLHVTFYYFPLTLYLSISLFFFLQFSSFSSLPQPVAPITALKISDSVARQSSGSFFLSKQLLPESTGGDAKLFALSLRLYRIWISVLAIRE